MEILTQLVAALRSGAIEVIDLTAPLSSTTPILRLPAPFGNTVPFALEEISKYDGRGPAWYWNNIRTGEHTGTHLDPPIHWVTGRDAADVSQIPLTQLVADAIVIDATDRVLKDPDFLLDIDDVKEWERQHGPLPDGGWLLFRTGWDARSHDEAQFLNADENGPHTPGLTPACARWLAEESPIIGLGVETVGTDAGGAHSFDPPFPCHAYLLGAGKYGLTQLQNLGRLPMRGAVVIAAPLPIVNGSGSPTRALALIER